MVERELRVSGNVLSELSEIASRMGGGYVDVGFMGHQTYPDGTSVATVAFWNEFGVPENNQPPRPFFQRMIDEHSGDWPVTLGAMAVQTDYNGPAALALLGEEVRGQLIDSVQALVEPPLSPVTIARKGFDKPLIETGLMVQSVTYEVKE